MQTIFCAAVSVMTTLLLFSHLSAQTPKTYVLDFLAGKPRPETQVDAERTATWARPLETQWDSGDLPVPFEVTLLSLDRSGYTIGDEATFEVLLKHKGTEPFPFPISQDRARFNREVLGAIRASVLLTVKDSMIGTQLVGADNIALGATSEPDSIVLLLPGDTVRIRAQAQWYFNKPFLERPADGWVRTVAVRAHLQVHGVRGFVPIVESANTIDVLIRQRP
jgi:hypothetical protein